MKFEVTKYKNSKSGKSCSNCFKFKTSECNSKREDYYCSGWVPNPLSVETCLGCKFFNTSDCSHPRKATKESKACNDFQYKNPLIKKHSTYNVLNGRVEKTIKTNGVDFRGLHILRSDIEMPLLFNFEIDYYPLICNLPLSGINDFYYGENDSDNYELTEKDLGGNSVVFVFSTFDVIDSNTKPRDVVFVYFDEALTGPICINFESVFSLPDWETYKKEGIQGVFEKFSSQISSKVVSEVVINFSKEFYTKYKDLNATLLVNELKSYLSNPEYYSSTYSAYYGSLLKKNEINSKVL